MADESGPIQFSRKPYTISYLDLHGQMQSIRRVPPMKLHDVLPTDIVELTARHNDDFPEGAEVEVKHINPRHPNTLQILNGEGETAFIDYYDMKLVDEVAPREGRDPRDAPVNNRYLAWP